MNKNITAVVLAGGLGTRLYPLTHKKVKCMLPLNGKPLLEHIIKYLASYGLRKIIITVGNKRKQIMDYFGNGTQLGVELQYSVERTTLGTAGSFKNAGQLINDTTLVMQGDTFTNFALNEIISLHMEKKTLATIALTYIQNQKGYGIAIVDRNKRIKQFKEKPAGSFSKFLVNSGIYVLQRSILNYIPENRAFDFSRDLFPLLLRKKLPLHGIEIDGYWFDIGTPESYKNAKEYAQKYFTTKSNM